MDSVRGLTGLDRFICVCSRDHGIMNNDYIEDEGMLGTEPSLTIDKNDIYNRRCVHRMLFINQKCKKMVMLSVLRGSVFLSMHFTSGENAANVPATESGQA